MTLTKLALAVLGTIGLTAGTVLAVSEPAPPPLPAALAQISAGRCPGSACGTRQCGSEGCPFSAKVAAVACESETCCKSTKCAAPPLQSEPIVAEVCSEHQTFGASAGTRCEACLASQKSCSESASLFDADGICRKHYTDHHETNACAARGHVLLTGTGSETCENGVCTADAQCEANSNGACESECPTANGNATRRITLGIGLSTGGPIVHVAAGPNEQPGSGSQTVRTNAPSVGRIVLSLITGAPCESLADSCDARQPITATACEAKPACADAACPVAACSASACHQCSHCGCDTCECDTCKCDAHSKDAAANGIERNGHEVVAFSDGRRYRVRDFAIRYFDGLDRVQIPTAPRPGLFSGLGDYPPLKVPNWDAEPLNWHPSFANSALFEEPAVDHASELPPVITPGRGDVIERDFDPIHLHRSADAPGRVRLTHAPVHVHYDSVPRPPVDSLPQTIRLSAFAAPVAAPLPPRAASPRLEGTWKRTSATSFTFENGRISGSWDATTGVRIDSEGKSIELKSHIRFSGSCTVTTDGQFIGVIDDIEVTREDGFSNVHGTPASVQRLIDQPFAARFVVDGDSLIVKDIRCGGLSPVIDQEDTSADLLQFVRLNGCGRYERAAE